MARMQAPRSCRNVPLVALFLLHESVVDEREMNTDRLFVTASLTGRA